MRLKLEADGKMMKALIPAGYLLMTLAFLYPMTLRLGSFIIGGGDDGPIGYWSLWWFKYAMVDLGQNPLTTDYMFFPDGASLVFHSMPKLMALLSIPLQSVLSLTLTYNLLVIATFVGTGVTTYLLVSKLTGARLPSFLAGAFFAFAPYRFGHISHLNLLATALIPLFILLVIKGKEAFDQGEKKGWLFFFIAGEVLALTAYDTEHYAIYLTLFSLIFLLFHAPRRRSRDDLSGWMKLGAGFLVTAGAAVLLFLPVLVQAIAELSREGDYVSFPQWKTVTQYSAGPLSFFRPYNGSRLLGSLGPLKEVSSIGWAVLGLAGLGIWVNRRKAQTRFWVLVAVVFMLLSLGPTLTINGSPTSIPGPQRLLDLVPLFGSPRVPARYSVMAALAATILAGFGLKALFTYLGKTRRGGAAVVGAAVMMMMLFGLEAYPAPRMVSTQVSRVYEEIAQSPLRGSVISLPLGWEAAPRGVLGMERTYQLMYQPVHSRKLVSGMVSRAPKELVTQHEGEPVIFYLCDPVANDPSQYDLMPEIVDHELSRYRPAFIVIHKVAPELLWKEGTEQWSEYTKEELEELDLYISGTLGMEKFSEDDFIVAYRGSA